MKTLIDAFFGDSEPKKYSSKAAQEFFAGSSAARKERAREAFAAFNKLPQKVRDAVFAKADIEPRRLYELNAKERVKLSVAAEKIRDDIADKLAFANVAAKSLSVLVEFKGDKA